MRGLTEKETQEAMAHILDNLPIEQELQRWKQEEENPVLMRKLLDVVAQRAKDDGGLIVSVKSDEVLRGAENIELFQADKKGDVNVVSSNGNYRFAMVFTSRERFKVCNDTSGFVVFIDELFRFLISQPDIDGIMLNLKKEEAVFGKEMMKKVLSMMEQG